MSEVILIPSSFERRHKRTLFLAGWHLSEFVKQSTTGGGLGEFIENLLNFGVGKTSLHSRIVPYYLKWKLQPAPSLSGARVGLAHCTLPLRD